MDDALIGRIEALERAVTDGDSDLSALADEADALDRLDRLDDQLDELQDRVAELEAATQALRGYVGNVRAVNEEVEKRADSALAKAEALEAATASQSSTRTSQRTAISPDGGLSSRHAAHPTRQQTDHTSGQCADEADGVSRQTHCEACGRDRPATGTPESNTGTGASDSFETLGREDPLVSEEDEDDSTPLGRFKELL